MANLDIKKGEIGNALESVAPDHVVTTADGVFDEGMQMYQNEINAYGGAYDISRAKAVDGNLAVFVSLSDALGTNGANVPVKTGGMSVKFVLNNSNYAVTKQEGLTTAPEGTLITSNPNVNSGTYKAAQLVAYFATLPTATGAGNALVYYKAISGDTTTYTSWTITLQSSDNKYVQARLMADSFTTDVTQWQGVDTEIITDSKNLAESGAVAKSIQDTLDKYLPTKEWVQLTGVEKTDGKQWVSDGAGGITLSGQNNRTAVKFDAVAGQKYYVQGYNTGTSSSHAIYFLNSSGKIIDGSTISSATPETIEGNTRCVQFTTPTDCVSVAYTAYQNSNYDLQKKEINAPIEKQQGIINFVGSKSDISYTNEEVGKVANKTINLYNPATISENKVLDYGNGSISSFNGYEVSDYIAIEAIFAMTYQSNPPSGLCCFYDKDKNFISGIATASVTPDNDHYTISCPAGTKYIRVCFRSADVTFIVSPWFYPSETIAYNVEYVRKLEDAVIPDTLQHKEDNSLQTNAKTVVGAINELFNGGGSGMLLPPWYVSPSGSDDTAAILLALTTYSVCCLVKGTYIVSNLTMPENTSLFGKGRDTIVLLAGNDSASGYAVKMNTGCVVKDILFQGSQSSITLSSTVLNRHGILWEGTYATDSQYVKQGIVDGCRFEHFKGGGITCRGTGTPVNGGLNVTNCYINDCRAGINIEVSSEFHRFTNVQCYACYYGCINNGGNNVFVNCCFSSNTLGFIMGNVSGAILTNTAHGSAIGCVFNHSHANNGIGIKIENVANGFIFSGCQMFYSNIDISDSYGIVFDSMNFGAQTIDITNGSTILFSDCMFGSAPTLNITNNDNVHFANSYVRSTGAVVNVS